MIVFRMKKRLILEIVCNLPVYTVSWTEHIRLYKLKLHIHTKHQLAYGMIGHKLKT